MPYQTPLPAQHSARWLHVQLDLETSPRVSHAFRFKDRRRIVSRGGRSVRMGLGNAAPPDPPRSPPEPPEPPGASRPAPAPAPRSCCGAIVPPRGRRRAQRQPRLCSAPPWLLAGWGGVGAFIVNAKGGGKRKFKVEKEFEKIFLIPIIFYYCLQATRP